MNYYTLLRLEAMDAQRFDLSKRRNPSNLTISIVAPSLHSVESGIPEITIESPESSPESSHFDESNESSSPTDDSVSPTPTVVEPIIFTHKNETQTTDVFERDGYSTTRTIIRPSSPRSPVLSIFSRPSSPVPASITRPSSPLGTNLANLNCMGSGDAFEEGLDFILQQRENDLADLTQEIKVEVTRNQAVFYEKKWKDAIQAILFDRPPPIVSCVGHVH